MTYNPDAPPNPYNPYDPRNDPFHPENPNPLPFNTGDGSGGGGGGGLPMPGGGGIVMLAILYFIMILSTASIISATIAAPVLVIHGKLLDWDNRPPWSWAFAAAFMGFFAYFLVAITIVGITGNRDLYDTPENLWTIANFFHAVQIQSLPLLACGTVIWWRLKDEFRAFDGVIGWLRSVFAAVLCLWISSAWIAATARRVADANPDSLDVDGLFGLGILSFFFAGLGALLGMIPIALGAKTAKTKTPTRLGFWRTYIAAFLVLLTWFNGSLIMEFFFNTLDPVYFFFKEEEVRAEVLRSHSQFGYLLPYFLGFLCTQLAVFGTAGGVIVKRLRPLFEGRSGWMLASAIAFFTLLFAITPFAFLLTAMYLSGNAKELFQSF